MQGLRPAQRSRRVHPGKLIARWLELDTAAPPCGESAPGAATSPAFYLGRDRFEGIRAVYFGTLNPPLPCPAC